MSSRSGVALCLILLALSLAAGAAVAHQSNGSQVAGDTPLSENRQETVTPNETVPPPEQIFHVELQRDGDARWQVAVEFTLRGDNDTATFEELASQFRDGDSEYVSVEWFRAAAARASDATDRPMTVRNVQRSAGIENDTGRLVLSFTWANFAQQYDETLAVGDAFNTTGDGWLSHLTADQTLYIEPPEEYGIRSRSGTPPVGIEDGIARWTGPISFSPDGINIVYAGNVQTTTTTTTTTTTATPTPTSPTTQPPTTDPGTDDGLAILPVVGLLVLVAALVTAVALRRNPDGSGEAGSVTSGDGSSGTDGTGGAQADTGAAGEPEAGTEVGDQSVEAEPGDGTAATDAADGIGATGAGAGAAAAAGESESGEADDIDEELLSDEERVERLLERNGGRMKQANIVSETGWSNAKVSQLLSSMDEAGRIDKLRIGRENLISFPDEDVADFDSEEP